MIDEKSTLVQVILFDAIRPPILTKIHDAVTPPMGMSWGSYGGYWNQKWHKPQLSDL